jgi:hypothetical protein
MGYKVGIVMVVDLEQQIRERAYQLWEQDGRVHGRADEYWYAAARELTTAHPHGSEIIVEVAEQKPRRRAPAKASPKAVAAAAPRRRRSTATPLQS